MKVGSVDVLLREKDDTSVNKEGRKGSVHERLGGVQRLETDKCKLIRKYRAAATDVAWACSGVLATVRDGNSIPLTQHRIWDAGFDILNLIPLGADKVFISSTQDIGVMSVINGALDFFNLLFGNFKPWNFDLASCQLGAWVRIYGIPLHAWNESFFKLCVLDCGRFLRSDGVSFDKD